MRLTGKRAIVAGASRGIGLEVVRLLCREGVKVLGVSRSGSPELGDTDAFPVQADLTRPDGVATLIAQTQNRLGNVDFLVTCIGGVDAAARQDDLLVTPDRWRATFELNVVTTIVVVNSILPMMRPRGAMVHIAGLAAHMPGAGPIDYSASKAALIATSRSFAVHARRYGVRSNTISPAPVATELWQAAAALNGISLDGLHERLPRALNMENDEMLDPAEIAAQTVFLLSPHAAGINGADLEVSGGLRL
jgi:NAD(P)-dependent dehydrogenase (short-subunit alcohol dehydrogenase family)